MLPKKMRILVIDDDPNIGDLVRSMLPEDGFEILEAADGPSGIQMASKQAPDLIVLDYQMPKVSGVEVLVDFRAHEATKNLPVLVCSADKRVGGTPRKGEIDFLPKPFSLPALREKVASLLCLPVIEENRAGR